MEMIQKCMIMCGFGQFFSLKWWWIGVMWNMCLLVSLNEVIWIIIDSVLMMNMLFMIISISFWWVIIVIVFSIVFSVSVLMLFMKIMVGQVLNYRKFRLVLVMVVQMMISLLVFGICGICRQLVNIMLFEVQVNMFSVQVISMVGMIVRLFRLLVRFIVLEKLMIQKQVMVMKLMLVSGSVIDLNIGMQKVSVVGMLVVQNRNRFVVRLKIDCSRYFQCDFRLFGLWWMILIQLLYQLMVLKYSIIVSISYMQWLCRFVYISIDRVMVSRISELFMVGVLVLEKWVCGLFWWIGWLFLNWVSLWIIVGLSYSDRNRVVSVVRMVWNVWQLNSLNRFFNCCNY